MEYFGYFSSICILFGLVQLLSGASVEDKYEPMVAFICERPAMHRGVNGWLSDKTQGCPDTLEDVLTYCKKVYPDHNITNVVESSRFYDIPNWPMGNAGRKHTHHVRPFRCLVGDFQSDALLVPQHCEFDHRHDITLCKEFSHWNRIADTACTAKQMHLESFGMLLYCKTLGHFNGVEYVCCPNPSTTPRLHPKPQDNDDKPDSWTSSEEDDDDSDETEDEDEDEDDSSIPVSSSDELPDESIVDLYEAYLRDQPFPMEYNNEHTRYLAAKDRMKKNQKKRVAKLLQEWEKAREKVSIVRKTDPKKANRMNADIAKRFQDLYGSFKQEDVAERRQLLALHQQHIQAILNERKRESMDQYMQALETGEVEKIIKYLHSYIKAEEKDRMHTVNHFEHIRYSAPKEALRIHRHIINHLKLSELRIDQALEMLTHYPSVEAQVRPEIEDFMKRFNAIATSIKNVVLPVPVIEDDSEEEESSDSDDSDSTSDINIDDSTSDFDSSSEEADITSQQTEGQANTNVVVDDEVKEDEHSYETNHHFSANAQSDTHSVNHGLHNTATAGTQIGSTVGIALGSVSVFVIIVVAVMMIHRNRNKVPVAHGYVEVDPSATPEERHLANMQMNGYENPTYKYFEVQNNPKA